MVEREKITGIVNGLQRHQRTVMTDHLHSDQSQNNAHTITANKITIDLEQGPFTANSPEQHLPSIHLNMCEKAGQTCRVMGPFTASDLTRSNNLNILILLCNGGDVDELLFVRDRMGHIVFHSNNELRRHVEPPERCHLTIANLNVMTSQLALK